MPDTSKCFSLVRGRVLRVTRLDGCGGILLGPTAAVVSKGFITVGFTAQTEEGTAISVSNANGDICISDTPAPKFTGMSATPAVAARALQAFCTSVSNVPQRPRAGSRQSSPRAIHREKKRTRGGIAARTLPRAKVLGSLA